MIRTVQPLIGSCGIQRLQNRFKPIERNENDAHQTTLTVFNQCAAWQFNAVIAHRPLFYVSIGEDFIAHNVPCLQHSHRDHCNSENEDKKQMWISLRSLAGLVSAKLTYIFHFLYDIPFPRDGRGQQESIIFKSSQQCGGHTHLILETQIQP